MNRLSAILCLLLLPGLGSSARAVELLASDLSPVVPTPGNTWYDAGASFLMDGSSVDFTIRFGVESVIPDTARIVGPNDDLLFDLGTGVIVIHSPGPWPDGYDGATMFFGTFDMPASLRTDFLAGQTTLELFGANAGDFTGPILPQHGDIDHDGDVDGGDITEMFANFNGPGGGVPANPATDLDGDGDADGVDLAVVFGQFTGPLAPASVPEPGSLVALVMGGLLVRRRSRPS